MCRSQRKVPCPQGMAWWRASRSGGATPRPRDISEVKLSPEFHDLHRDIWHMLKEEVVKGYAQAEGR